jgi:uncharacterized membrane protein
MPMSGMLYLPRLFIYRCAAEKGSVQPETFKVMERRLCFIGKAATGQGVSKRHSDGLCG